MPTLSTKANRLYPSLPNIDSELDSHTAALQAIKDAVQTHERQDGNYLKSFIRFEELIDLGLIDSEGTFILNVDVETGESSIALGDLSDVVETSPGDNAILGYDTSTSKWIDQTAAQLGLATDDHTHPPASVTIDLGDLNDVDTTGSHSYDLLFRNTAGDWVPTDQLLQWDGSDLHLPQGDLHFYEVGGSASSALRQNDPESGDFMLQAPSGNIYLQPGVDVILDGLSNLVIESDQYIQWFNAADAKVNLLHFVPVGGGGGGGSAVGHVIKHRNAGTTTTNATYQDVTGAVVTFAEMEANEDYVVYVRAYIGSSGGNTSGNGCQLTKGGTLVGGSEMFYEPPWGLTVDDIGMLYYWAGIISSGASGDLQMQIKSGNGSDTAFANNISIMMIKVADLVLNTDIFYDVDTSLLELNPSYAGTGASVTIGDGASDYLVFGSMSVNNWYAGAGNQADVEVYDGSTSRYGSGYYIGDASDQLTLGFMHLYQAPSASTTLTVRAKSAFYTIDEVYSSIIAIRLSVFSDYQADFSAASGAFSGGSGDTDVVTVAFTAADTDNYCLMACGTGTSGGATDCPDPIIRNDLNIGGDVTVAGELGQDWAVNSVHTSFPHWLVSSDQSWSASDTVDADYNVTHGSAGGAEWFNNFIVSFAWSLPGGGGGADEFFDIGNAGYVTRHLGQSSQFFDVGLTDYVQFDHDGVDFNISGFQTADINITGIDSIQAGTVDADFDVITGTRLILPLLNDPTTPSFAFGDGDTGFYQIADGYVGFTSDGVLAWQIGPNDIVAAVGNGPRIMNEAATAINPTLIPSLGAPGTGIGGLPQKLDLIVNSLSAMHIREAGGFHWVEAPTTVFHARVSGAAVPAYTFYLDNTTGMYSGGASSDILLFSAGGVEALRLAEVTGAITATVGGRLVTVASTTDAAGLSIPIGVAPTTPVQGDIWSTATDLLMEMTGGTEINAWISDLDAVALGDLFDVDLTGAADNDLLHRSGGDWIDTAGALTWDGSALATTGIISLPGGVVGAPSLAFTGDLDTGIFSPGANIFVITAGGTEAVRYTGASAHLIDYSMNSNITASTTQTQGQEPLTCSYNNISTVANNDDVITLPTCAIGRFCLVVNSGAKRLQAFPASGDDLGQGTDNSDTIKANTSLLFMGLSDTVWHDVATKLESLQGVDLTDAADGDLLVRVSGIWEDTAGALTWDGSALETTGVVSLPAGTEGAPALTFTGQLNTGMFSPGEHIIAITCGGTEAVRWTGSSPPVVDYAMVSGITASTTQTQGQEPLTCSFNTVSVVANDDDVVTLPSARKGRHCHVINVGANRLQIFPVSGQDLGHGVDVSITVKPNSNVFFIGFDATAWQDNSAHFGDLQDVEVDGETDNDLLTFSSGVLVPTSAPIVSSVSAVGTLKLNPLATGDVSLFASADVDNADDGRKFYVRRQAAEGDSYMRMYITAGQNAVLHANVPMSMQAAQPLTVNSTTDDVRFQVGDDAGVQKIRFRDSNGADVATIDSDGRAAFAGRVTVGSMTLGNERLRVEGSEATTNGNQAAIAIENLAAGGDTWYLRAGATGTATPVGGFSIADTSAYRFVIDEDGNVGIGLIAPTVQFHIEKSYAGALTSKLYNQDAVDGIAHQLVGANTGGHINLIANASSSAYLGIPGGMAGLAVNYVNGMAFAVSGGATPAEMMRLTSTGLGIKKVNPAQALDIVGNIAVTGTVDGRDVAADGTTLDGIVPPEIFIPAGAGILGNQATFQDAQIELADAGTFARCTFTIRLPSDWSSMAAGYPKVIFAQGTGGTGNYRIAFNCYAGGPGEQLGARIDNIAEYTMAAPGQSSVIWEENVSAAFDGLSLAGGHYIQLRIQRDTDDALDTFAGDLDVLGVVVKYTW